MTTRRWLAERADTGLLLHSDLPVDGSPERRLRATGSLTLEIPVDIATMDGDDGLPLFDNWGTIIHLEVNDQIEWSGWVIDRTEDGAKVEVECGSIMAYFYGQAWTGELSGVNLDPADIIRSIVAHEASFPDGIRNLSVVGSTSARVGIPASGSGDDAVEAKPYTLSWWDNRECGAEIDQLADEAPFDWWEEHHWNDPVAKDYVVHTMRIADRLGGRREDLTFQLGVNISAVPQLEEDGDDYASEINALGAGEGKLALRSIAAVRRKGRVRRAKIIDETKDIQSKARLDAAARLLLRVSAGVLSTEQIEVRDHIHAPLGSWNLGDEILVEFVNAAGEPFSLWYMIVSEELVDNTTAVLNIMPVLDA